MIKKMLTIALLLPTLLWAKVPSEEDILEKITDIKGGLYYPDLMLRFEMGDLSLTLDEYHYLYYGYQYRDEYAPMRSNPQLDRLIAMAADVDYDNPSVEVLESIVGIADEILVQDPFNPKVWNILAYAYGALGDKDKELGAYDRVNKILQTIDSSGDGLNEKRAKHILMLDHALDLMASENLQTKKAIVISRDVQFVPIVEPIKVDGKKFKGYYFDYSRIYKNKPEGVVFTKARTWQFNNLKPREYK